MTKPVNLVRYDMSSCLESCVDAYCERAKVKKDQLPNVATPFTEAGIARPTLDDKESPRRLQPIASKVLMKILFAARMARPDLLRATQSLASRVTKWSIECDIALHRLVSYVHSSTEVFMEGFVVGILLMTLSCGFLLMQTTQGSLIRNQHLDVLCSLWGLTLTSP